jgi:endonuclease/exonuclease/phosphatase (EEP) superfamily protein YafD
MNESLAVNVRPLGSRVKSIFAFVTGTYLILMIGYLLLRLTVGDGLWWLSLLNAFAHLLFLPLIVLLPLALLIHRRSALRLAPLVVVGGLWFAPYYLPRPSQQLSQPALRVLTFNVWGDNPQLEAVEAWIRNSNADVVLLQEIPVTYSENGLPGLLDLYPYQFVQSLEMRFWGNAVLSRIPFDESEYFDLEADGTPSHQRVVFDWQGESIALYNIHLLMPIGEQAHLSLPFDNPFLNMALKYDDGARNAQIVELLTRIEQEPYPFIIAGDFNTSDQSLIYQQLATLGNDAFREAGAGLGASWPMPAAGELPISIPPIIRIDYIWYSDAFQAIVAWQGPELGSDHLALQATLSLLPSQ